MEEPVKKINRMSNRERTKKKKKLYSDPLNRFCFFCRDPLTYKKATLEHLIPIARGGGNAYSNLVICCTPCNNAKANLTVYEFLRFAEANGGLSKTKQLYGKGGHTRITKDFIQSLVPA